MLHASTKYQLYSLWIDPTELDLTIYRTQGEHTNYYATDVDGVKYTYSSTHIRQFSQDDRHHIGTKISYHSLV